MLRSLSLTYRLRRLLRVVLLVVIGMSAGWGVTTAAAQLSPVESVAVPPADVRLEANYPNPFSEQTAVRYHLERPAVVTLEVFDALGRRTATLVDGLRAAGAHTAVFQAKDRPNGLYILRLSADGVTRTGIMTLVR